jgi:energy-coupling factor transporter ATP-binding protein EcfA2
MTPDLDVQNLSYRYPDGTAALLDISFSITPGATVGLIGPNGAGKSTLLLHFNGVLPETLPGEAAIRVAGLGLLAGNLHEVRRRVGLLFQDPDDQLFCPTVFDDVAFGPRQLGGSEGEIRGLVMQCLAQVGLAGFEDRSPSRLSMGEKRRVCLAGVLACKPAILVLDEPTAGLDPRGRRELVTLLRTIPTTQIIATHDLQLVVELCSRTLLLDHGRIIADGRTEELLGDEALMLAHGLEKPHILQHQHPHGGMLPIIDLPAEPPL